MSRIPLVGRAWLAVVTPTLALTCVACASTGATPRPFPVPGGSSAPAGSSATRAPGKAPALDTYALVGTALALRGAPYRNGGADPQGFDCSGFTQYVYAQYGVALPRAVRDQYQSGQSVDPRDLAPGDLVFFTTTDPGASHVAIAVGGDEFVHAPSSTGVVRVERLSSSYWSPRFVGARRMTPAP
jgi:cell wall-associated NlpC family hydrolase